MDRHMLGRTANGLFWMFRYLERVENTARLIDAAQRMALTRDIVTAEEEWRSVMETLSQRASYESKHGTYTGVQAWNFLLRDKDNPANLLALMRSVRTNARAVRTAISSELWTAINESWMEIDEALSRPVAQSNLGDVIKLIKRAGTLAHGAVANSMLRDAGYNFARAGMFVERADSTARVLDMKYYLLLPSVSYVGSSLDAGQWDQLLRSVSGDRAFRWLNAGKADARGIVEFLILDQRFPRSLAYSYTLLRENLTTLAKIHGTEGRASELIRDSSTALAELTIDMVFDEGLHQFLKGFQRRNGEIADAIAEDYRFLA